MFLVSNWHFVVQRGQSLVIMFSLLDLNFILFKWHLLFMKCDFLEHLLFMKYDFLGCAGVVLIIYYRWNLPWDGLHRALICQPWVKIWIQTRTKCYTMWSNTTSRYVTLLQTESMFPLKFLCWNLNSEYDGSKPGAFVRKLDHMGGALKNGMCALKSRGQRASLLFPALWGCDKKSAT